MGARSHRGGPPSPGGGGAEVPPRSPRDPLAEGRRSVNERLRGHARRGCRRGALRSPPPSLAAGRVLDGEFRPAAVGRARRGGEVMTPHTGSVRLVDRRTRMVEVLGPEPLGSRHPTDRKLLFDQPRRDLRPWPVGFCFQADGRKAKFLVDEGERGEALLDLLASRPKTPARPARPYGPRGWLVEG